MFKLVLFLSLLSPFYLHAQSEQTGRDPGNTYDPGPGIVNGKEYYPYYLRSRNKPLLFIDQERTSTVNIDGITFNVVLHYDTYTGEVIYAVPSGSGINTSMISLNKDIIKAFTLNFYRDTLKFEFRSGKGLNDGYYEIAWTGSMEFLIHHRSLVSQKNGTDEYFYHPVSFILVNGEYHRIKSAGKFVELFDEDRKLAKTLVRKHNVNFKKPVRGNIVSMMEDFSDQKPFSGK